MAWADSRRPLKPQAKIRSRVSPSGICNGQIGTGVGFLRTASVFPRKYHPTIAPCMLLLPEEQMGKTWEPSSKQKTNVLAYIGGPLTEKFFKIWDFVG